MTKIFITGASGFLGRQLFLDATRSGKNVYGSCNTQKIFSDKIFQVNLLDISALEKIIEKTNPEVIIHTAALSKPNECQEQPEQSEKINFFVTDQLAKIAQRKKIHFVFISTDQVFDGSKGNYSETDQPNPINIYGKHKLKAEQSVLKTSASFQVMRLPLLFGNSKAAKTNFIEEWTTKFKNGTQIKLFVDEYRSPVDVCSASQGILELIKRSVGIVHLGGDEKISRFEFGYKIIKILSLSTDLIIPVNQSQIKFSAARPADVSLDNSLAHSLGYLPQNLDKALIDILKEHYEAGNST